MTEFDESSRPTRRDPGVTRADRVDPDRTRRDAGVPHPAPPVDPLVRLPGSLAGRFIVVGELPVQGAESDLLLVRDPAAGPGAGPGNGELVVKIYRRGFHADRDVWAKLPELESPHVMHVLETGHADGRDYEILEYLPHGNLRSLIPRESPALPPARVAEIAGQLADGLRRLHGAGIVHRDLKPENVLVASAEPPHVVITDFGLSRVLDQSVVFASSSRTLAYAAPESLSGQVSPARDWWSLGMIVRELLTGAPPFAGMSETVVVDHLATRPIDNDDIADPRLRLLCQGLLTRDPRRRWSGRQVSEWLAGGSPVVASEAPVEPPGPARGGGGLGRAADRTDTLVAAGRGLPFNGRRYTERGELARALVTDWERAAHYFFGRGEGSEAWRTLRDWLAGLDDATLSDADAAGRIELVDTALSGPLPPDVKLLYLIRWLDPALPPHYLGHRVTAGDLHGLAALAADDRAPGHRIACRIGLGLWDHRLLPVLDGFTGEGTSEGSGGGADGTEGTEGTATLIEIDDRWHGQITAWNRLAAELRPRLPAAAARRLPEFPGPGTAGSGTAGPDTPGTAHAADPPVVLLTLLALAAAPGGTADSLAVSVARAREVVPEPVPWFDALADAARSDPLRLLAVVATAPAAAAEADAAVRDRTAAARRAEDHHRWWQEREQARLAGRDAAVRRAVLWSVPLLALWIVGGLVVDALFGGGPAGDSGTTAVGGFQRSPGLPLSMLLACGTLTWLAQMGAEVFVARRQAKDYLPYGPWSWLSRLLRAGGQGLSAASQAVSGTAQRSGRRGCGFLLIAGIVPVLLLLILLAALSSLASPLWLIALFTAAVGHVIGAGVRLHHWRQAHETARRQALEGTM